MYLSPAPDPVGSSSAEPPICQISQQGSGLYCVAPTANPACIQSNQLFFVANGNPPPGSSLTNFHDVLKHCSASLLGFDSSSTLNQSFFHDTQHVEICKTEEMRIRLCFLVCLFFFLHFFVSCDFYSQWREMGNRAERMAKTCIRRSRAELVIAVGGTTASVHGPSAEPLR